MKKVLQSILSAIAVTLTLISAVNAQIPGKNPTTMKVADSLYYAGNFANAKIIYNKLLGDTSHNSIAWNRLGFSNYNTGNYEAALVDYQNVFKFKPIPPVKASAYSRIARINALQNKPEAAYMNIDSAIASGYGNYKELDTLKDFAKIRNTEEFKQRRTASYNTAFPCMANAHAREFDFWAGEWNVVATKTNAPAGYSLVTIIAGGCGLLENWTNIGGGKGKSINFIEPVSNKWKQSWVGGGVQEFVNGEYKDGAMRFTFETTNAQGLKIIGRFVFFNEGKDKVRQFNETSADNGKTWATTYDFTYLRIKESVPEL